MTKTTTNHLLSVRALLLALVTICLGPMLLLAIAISQYQGRAGPLAIATACVVACTAMLGWRFASYISTALEELSAAVRAAGDAPIRLPSPRFKEERRLGQSFIYATEMMRDAHAALKRNEACLRTVLDTARDAIVTTDDRNKIILFNRAAEKMFGISESEALGAKLDRLVPLRFRGQHAAQMRSMSAHDSKPRRMGPARVVWALHADGHTFPIHASISCGVDGTRRYFTAIIREVVEVPVLADELDQRDASITSDAERNASTAAGKPQ